MLEDVPFDTIDLSTLERLKANGVSESRTIDYKRDEPAKDREAFLANVTSLANTLGGYLLYGVDASEGGGTPSAFPGFGVEDTDLYELRLNQMVRDNVDPRMPPPDYRWIDVASGRKALVVRVRQSWSAPHAAMRHGRYYLRTSNGKQPMDTHELRNAFLLAGRGEEQFELFCSSRAKTIVLEGPAAHQSERFCALQPGLVLVCHIAPLASMARNVTLDIRSALPKFANIAPARAVAGWHVARQPNASGFLARIDAGASTQPTHGYCQVFRRGAIESVAVFEPTQHQHMRDGIPTLYAGYFERVAIGEIRRGIALLRDLELGGPILTQLRILRGAAFVLQSGGFQSYADSHRVPLGTNALALPPIVFDDPETKVGKALRPAFDAFWQAFGRGGCAHYSETGDWVDPG
jgi:hypothetical protein